MRCILASVKVVESVLEPLKPGSLRFFSKSVNDPHANKQMK